MHQYKITIEESTTHGDVKFSELIPSTAEIATRIDQYGAWASQSYDHVERLPLARMSDIFEGLRVAMVTGYNPDSDLQIFVELVDE